MISIYRMKRSMHPKILVLSTIVTLCCWMTWAAPADPPILAQIDALVQEFNAPNPSHSPLGRSALTVSEIDSVYKPRVSEAVRSLISQYKSVAAGCGQIIYGNTVSNFVNSAEMSSFSSAIVNRKDLIMADADAYFQSQLDEIFAPAHVEFMAEASYVLNAFKKALPSDGHGVNSKVIVDGIISALNPMEQALKEEVMDYLMESVPDMIEHVLRYVIEVVEKEVDPNEHASDVMELTNSLLDSISDMADHILESADNVVHNNHAEGKKLLEDHFSLNMPGGGSSILRHELCLG